MLIGTSSWSSSEKFKAVLTVSGTIGLMVFILKQDILFPSRGKNAVCNLGTIGAWCWCLWTAVSCKRHSHIAVICDQLDPTRNCHETPGLTHPPF